MEVAIFSEGDPDEAGLRVLVDAVLGITTTPTTVPFRTRGWPAVADQLPSIIRNTYFKTSAPLLVVVADGNGSSLDPQDPTNRLTRLRDIAARCQPQGRADRPSLQIVVGIAFPCIEAWWLAPQFADVSEKSWGERNSPGVARYSKQELKRRLYGQEFPGIPHATARMQAGAGKTAAALADTKDRFPLGFGSLIAGLENFRVAANL